MKLLTYYCEVYFGKQPKKNFINATEFFLVLKDKINTFASEYSGNCPTYYY